MFALGFSVEGTLMLRCNPENSLNHIHVIIRFYWMLSSLSMQAQIFHTFRMKYNFIHFWLNFASMGLLNYMYKTFGNCGCLKTGLEPFRKQELFATGWLELRSLTRVSLIAFFGLHKSPWPSSADDAWSRHRYMEFEHVDNQVLKVLVVSAESVWLWAIDRAFRLPDQLLS